MRLTRLAKAAILMTAGAGALLAQTASVTFLGMDTTTLGNWKGVYGQDGWYLPEISMTYAPYSGLVPIQDNQRLLDIWSCWSTPCDARELLKPQPAYSYAERVESYFYNRDWEEFQVNTSDGQTHRIALYFADYEYFGRSITVTARDTNTGVTLDKRTLDSYSGGVYLVYNYTGNVTFRIQDNFPLTDLIPNGTVSGFFWGGSGGPPSAAPAAPVVYFSPTGPAPGSTISGQVPLQVAVDSMPGVKTVQYYLDGAPLGPPQQFFLTDILATPLLLPFQYTWDTTSTTNGPHTLKAVATDVNGLSTTSAGLNLAVSNGGVVNPTPALVVSAGPLNFSGTAGGSNPPAQSISIGNGGGGSLAWTAASNQSWLGISPASGSGNANPGVSVNLSGLAAGTYSGKITVTATGATGSPAQVAVNLNVLAPTPILSVSPGSLDFSATAGGANPASQPVSISNTGAGSLSWTAQSDQAWLSISPASGTAAAKPNVSVNIAGLNAGSYTGHITVDAGGATGSPAKVTVSLNVTPAAGSGQTYVYVSDPNNHRVQQFNDAGAWTSSLGPGSAKTLGYPINVATDATGDLYVADQGTNTVQKYSSNGAWLATIGSGVLNSPTGLAVDSSGNIYVGDTGDNRVVEFSPGGSILHTYTGLYTGGGYLGVAVDSSGTVYADDYYNGRLKKFANNGTLLATFGSGYWQAYPGDIQIDGSGNVWVGDPYRGGLQEFSSAGAHLASVAGPGGYFAIDAGGNVWASCGYTFCEYSRSGALLKTGGAPTGGQFGNGYGACNGCTEGVSGMAAAPPARQ